MDGIDLRVFVRPPFWPCPRCRAEAFGVYQIAATGYTRRCRECWYASDFPLWPLSRKIIYLDQFVISNMMKALNRAHRRHEATIKDPFWVKLFERLDRLVKLQLVICPDSNMHTHESFVTEDYEPLKRMYEHLSHGVTFESPEVITLRQLNTSLVAWLDNKEPVYDFHPENVTTGGVNEWKERYIISVSGEYPKFIVDATREARKDVYQKTKTLYEDEICKAPNTDFDYWLARERRAGARAVLQSAQLFLQRLEEIVTGKVAYTLENVYQSHGLDQYNQISAQMKARGLKGAEWAKKMKEFLDSDTYKDFPSNRISSLVWAVISQAAALGQKMVPDEGTSSDINVLALQPFCDAIFVDNRCRALWEKVPRKHRPSYSTRLFSYNTREQFLAYLEKVEREGDPAVIASAREVRGDPQPFLTMYEQR